MQQQVNLRNKYGQLLDYMKEIGYKDSSIRYMYRTVQKILSVTETPSAEDYEFLINQQNVIHRGTISVSSKNLILKENIRLSITKGH